MSRIDEIRNRLELTNSNKLHSYGDGDVREDSSAEWVAEFKDPNDAEFFINARSDTAYLLSTIDSHETALIQCRAYANFVQHISDGANIYRIANKALEQLKEVEYAMNDKQKQIIELMKQLNDEERLLVIEQFCNHCGDVNPNCQCSNDE